MSHWRNLLLQQRKDKFKLNQLFSVREMMFQMNNIKLRLPQKLNLSILSRFKNQSLCPKSAQKLKMKRKASRIIQIKILRKDMQASNWIKQANRYMNRLLESLKKWMIRKFRNLFKRSIRLKKAKQRKDRGLTSKETLIQLFK